MSSFRFVILSLVLSCLALSNAYAEGNPDNGAELAQEWCKRCHNVDPSGPFKEHPPSFAAIAIFRSEEQIYGRIAFGPVHSGMPQMAYILSPNNIRDIVAYILSLERKEESVR